MTEQTLDEFVDEQKELLDKFEKEWLNAHAKAPESFPMTMLKGDWDESLYDFEGKPYDTEGLD
jgi:hypothetical protein